MIDYFAYIPNMYVLYEQH